MAVIDCFPPPSPILSARLHPVVLFNICDCYVRPPDQAERVIGTLLGSVSNGVLDIKNSYAVPHNQPADQVCLFQCRISLHSSDVLETIVTDKLPNDMEGMEASTKRLYALIDDIYKYVDVVVRDNFALIYLSSLIRTQLSTVEKLNMAAQIL
ncbi:hypothetical protein C4D60_Mb02t16690 [Musa balbisiana]|uniref:JAB1/MPN/MOV34 metalloenzyme domain-containing protein n=1 Tax=Musa balbisiana TaxID=52838 RepID=A0A4S8IB90_MUSBA|nr:hypothetical protein C4D60_Mb02t16690 [Musa balbisiana]